MQDHMMRKRWIGMTLAMSFGSTAAAAETPVETEARNAAAGFAITTSLTLLEALGKQCGTYEGEAGKKGDYGVENHHGAPHRGAGGHGGVRGRLRIAVILGYRPGRVFPLPGPVRTGQFSASRTASVSGTPFSASWRLASSSSRAVA